MKHFILSLLLLLAAAQPLCAQTAEPVTETAAPAPAAALPPAAPQYTVRYGYLNADSLLRLMPDYAAVRTQMGELRRKYRDEATYNETTFRRQFAEFLEGQKDFPENILLKRQADLQASMEKGLAFRHQADSLLRQTEAELLRPVRARLAAAISAVGAERGLALVLDTSAGAVPYLNPALCEDITALVSAKLQP